MAVVNDSIEQQSFDAKNLKVGGVTVYSDRAEVTRLVLATLKKGKNEVLVKNVSHMIDSESVRVDGRGPAVICEVQYQQKATKRGEVDHDRIKQLTAEKDALEKKRFELEDSVKVLTRQGEVLDGVAVQVGKGSSSAGCCNDDKKSSFVLSDESLANLAKFLGFYDEKVTAVQGHLRTLSEEMKQLNEEIEVLDRRINELRYGDYGDLSRDISILLDSEEGGEVELDVSYQVYGANWRPSYDIRVFTNSAKPDEKSAMKIYYYGMITQNTGEDWTDAPLMLSTATPSTGGVIPSLPTRIVAFYKPPIRIQSYSGVMDDECEELEGLAPPSGRNERKKRMSSMRSALASVAEGDRLADASEKLMEYAGAQAEESVISTCFVIARPSTIPSDGAEHKVSVTVIDLEPRFEHETVPSKTPVAFLTAKVINTSTFPLLSGPTSIYLNNSFVAKSSVKAVSPKEEFDCSLGADPAVRVNYKPASIYHERAGLISKTSVNSHEQRIEIKNTKVGEKIKIVVHEQIPKSTDEKIKITVLQPELPKKGDEKKLAEFAVKMDKNNNLEWTVNIAPNETRELVIKYKIEHPSNEKIEFRHI
uniref:Protein F37C4.5 n=1 Tax=Plectus sambesii TaxID=2011161 RepID=A0A914WYI1_9BILA